MIYKHAFKNLYSSTYSTIYCSNVTPVENKNTA